MSATLLWIIAAILVVVGIVQLIQGQIILGIVFQLAHVVEETHHPEPDMNNAMAQSWVVHELATTSNFAPRNRLLNWYVGGLNFQVEHHLFPKVCSVHYPAISGIVRSLAAKYDLPYNSHDTMTAAIASPTFKPAAAAGEFASRRVTTAGSPSRDSIAKPCIPPRAAWSE